MSRRDGDDTDGLADGRQVTAVAARVVGVAGQRHEDVAGMVEGVADGGARRRVVVVGEVPHEGAGAAAAAAAPAAGELDLGVLAYRGGGGDGQGRGL